MALISIYNFLVTAYAQFGKDENTAIENMEKILAFAPLCKD